MSSIFLVYLQLENDFMKKNDFNYFTFFRILNRPNSLFYIFANTSMKKGNSFSSSDASTYYVLNSEAKAFLK